MIHDDLSMYPLTDPRASVESPDSRHAAQRLARMLDGNYHSAQVWADVRYYFPDYVAARAEYDTNLMRDRVAFAEQQQARPFDLMDFDSFPPSFDEAQHASEHTRAAHRAMRALEATVLQVPYEP